MIYCLNTSTIKPQSLMDKIRLVGEAGYDGIELWLNDVWEFVARGGEVSDIEKALAARYVSTASPEVIVASSLTSA